MRRSKNVSITRQVAGRRAMGLTKSGLLGATALLLLTALPQAAGAQGNSSNTGITINRDVIESLDNSGYGQGRSTGPQQQTTPWGTPLPGSPYARLPNRSAGTGQAATGDGGLAFPPREMPRSTLLIGEDTATTTSTPTRSATAPTSQERRSTSSSTTPSSRSTPQAAARQEAPAQPAPSQPARGKPRSVLPPEETETHEPIDTDSGLRDDERTTPVPEPADDGQVEQDASTQMAEDNQSDAGADQPDSAGQPTDTTERQTDLAADEDEAGPEPSPEQQESQQAAPVSDEDTDENGTDSQVASADEDLSSDTQDSTRDSTPEEQAAETQEASQPERDARSEDSQPDETQADETQQASLPDATETGQVSERTIEFTSESADLSEASRSQLRQLAAQLSERSSMRVQLLAYAEGSDEDASQARRLSLSRALAVRAYLLDHGIRSTRIDVRALGHNAPGDGSVNRVDIVPEDPEDS
ncbi:OmpA family protein [Fodinicurvata fenggangensis]|uniref:OmpA family protein n=1 Tax=Fodinicurvata fenggangensis TaxID=1121830 RepID=UPI0012DBE2D9|nr:OmpA family protein [Fodinicurvata fenggangensis]